MVRVENGPPSRPFPRRIRAVLIVTTLIVVCPVVVLALFNSAASRPSHLGVHDGRLAECPASPNCVSTQSSDERFRMEPMPFQGPPEEAMQRLRKILEQMPRAQIITADDTYMHVEFTSRVFRFVDDVEFLIEPDTQRIHFRSASRVGYSDFGVNRRRMQQIRSAFQATD
jgi:uncharacterized protein (DUF1499 family)